LQLGTKYNVDPAFAGFAPPLLTVATTAANSPDQASMSHRAVNCKIGALYGLRENNPLCKMQQQAIEE